MDGDSIKFHLETKTKGKYQGFAIFPDKPAAIAFAEKMDVDTTWRILEVTSKVIRQSKD